MFVRFTYDIEAKKLITFILVRKRNWQHADCTEKRGTSKLIRTISRHTGILENEEQKVPDSRNKSFKISKY